MKISELLKQRPTLSFEIFPPKKQEENMDDMLQTIDELAQLNPDFISVTYGAGGSTTKNTVEIASIIKNKYHIESVAHLSCIDATKQQLTTILDALKENNIENILALRGDYPKDFDASKAPNEFRYASELNNFICEQYPNDFCLSGACYPEVHEEADSLESDLAALKAKVDAGASYLITQIFFDNNYYYRLLREAKNRGIHVPIIAGIMPATNAKQLLHISKLSGCNIPYELSAMIEQFSNNKDAMLEIGLNYAVYQMMDLISNGVEGIHIYTMNKPHIAKEILRRSKTIMSEFTSAKK